jgi:GTP-binding protein YchF
VAVTCGIVGLPNVGKTTIFNALTAAAADASTYANVSAEPNVAMVEVPDDRLGVIGRFVETKKTIPAAVQVVDIAGLREGSTKGEGTGNRTLAPVREVDAIMQVVQCFENPQVMREGPVDPTGDMEIVELELAMADLDTITRAVERVSKKARSGDKQSLFEKDVYERAKAALEEGTHVRHLEWKPQEEEALRPLCLLTVKPILYVANLGDDDVSGTGEWAKAVAARAEETGSVYVGLCGDLECELRRMEPEDAEVFMSEYGLEQTGLDRLIRATYELLGLQTFFTAGEKEIRAWTIHRGDVAPVAAGAIHSDFEKAFIRAEVYSVDDLAEFESEAAIRTAGKLRTEGRDYVMQEGDVCNFLIGK